ncbi:hypothetical protein Ancab_003119 [Ancistrocladus abbreviatus]
MASIYTCNECGTNLNLSTIHVFPPDFYFEAGNKNTLSFSWIDSSRFKFEKENKFRPFFETLNYWGIQRNRTKIKCNSCGILLGYVYDDGPPLTDSPGQLHFGPSQAIPRAPSIVEVLVVDAECLNLELCRIFLMISYWNGFLAPCFFTLGGEIYGIWSIRSTSLLISWMLVAKALFQVSLPTSHSLDGRVGSISLLRKKTVRNKEPTCQSTVAIVEAEVGHDTLHGLVGSESLARALCLSTLVISFHHINGCGILIELVFRGSTLALADAAVTSTLCSIPGLIDYRQKLMGAKAAPYRHRYNCIRLIGIVV